MTTPAIVAALVHAMSVVAPPARLAAPPAWPGWAETAEERAERYKAIAAAAWAVSSDEGERPLFPGAKGRQRTAALLIGVAFMETSFAKDADEGPCYRGRDGKGVRCDSGRSSCLMQIQIGAGRTAEGWTQAELFADREKCFRAGLHLIRKSFAACASEGPDGLLNAYAVGHCNSLIARAKSQPRLAAGRRIFELAQGFKE